MINTIVQLRRTYIKVTLPRVPKDIKYKDKNVVVILPDTGERYLSTEYFD